jgi:hypothetical protein
MNALPPSGGEQETIEFMETLIPVLPVRGRTGILRISTCKAEGFDADWR